MTQLDIFLCKAVSEAGAHVARRNEKCKIMEKACIVMIEALPGNHRATYHDPTWKTCNDNFELIMKQRRGTDRVKRNQSGIYEEVRELDMLLDDLIVERDTID